MFVQCRVGRAQPFVGQRIIAKHPPRHAHDAQQPGDPVGLFDFQHRALGNPAVQRPVGDDHPNVSAGQTLIFNSVQTGRRDAIHDRLKDMTGLWSRDIRATASSFDKRRVDVLRNRA